jgi:hypothetical protein
MKDESVYSKFLLRKKIFHKYEKKFAETFKTPLRFFYDINSNYGLLTGFDVLKFDNDVIQAAKNENVADAVRRLYGKEAVKMLELLIKT